MKRFEYLRPATLEAALAAGAAPGAAWLGGGTNLLDLMKLGVALPAVLVDLRDVAELRGIETLADGSVRIGAMVRNAALAEDAGFAARFPAVAEAVLSGASGQIRNAASLGGNLMQRTRCGYFQDPDAACNRRAPGAGCAALAGDAHGHAVLGWSADCVATHPSDLAVALVALDAVVEIAGPAGRREVALEAFHALPGEGAVRESVLEPGELIVAVRLPASAAGFAGHARYLKLRERTSFAFALVSAMAGLRMAGPLIAEARIALGGVAARPWRARGAEALLVGRAAEPELFAAAARAALADARPTGDSTAKIELARRSVARALVLAAAGTPDSRPALPGSVFAPLTGATAHV